MALDQQLCETGIPVPGCRWISCSRGLLHDHQENAKPIWQNHIVLIVISISGSFSKERFHGPEHNIQFWPASLATVVATHSRNWHESSEAWRELLCLYLNLSSGWSERVGLGIWNEPMLTENNEQRDIYA
jgi:hypothetical protein